MSTLKERLIDCGLLVFYFGMAFWQAWRCGMVIDLAVGLVGLAGVVALWAAFVHWLEHH